MSFSAAPVLLGLLVLPALAILYAAEQRRAARAAALFTTVTMRASSAPRRPGARRHVPALLLALAIALLIVAAARPRVHQTVPVKGATVMLVNDVSDSMTSTDVSPSRLVAARQAATSFTHKVPDTIAIGSIDFARHPVLLQSPSSDHALARAALLKLKPGGGGTAIGEAIELALGAIRTAPKVAHKTPPGAIVLLSDGTSNVGVSPYTAAALAKRQHVPIDTIAIGTAGGTMVATEHGHRETIPVPVSPGELDETAQISGGHFFRAPDRVSAKAIYARLARQLGHMRIERGLIGEFTAAGLLLVLAAVGLGLRWFGALA